MVLLGILNGSMVWKSCLEGWIQVLRIIICEDDRNQRKQLGVRIRQAIEENDYPAIVIAETAGSLSFMYAVNHDRGHQSEIDRMVYFLDIDLRDLAIDGFGLAAYIRQYDQQGYIVFLSALDQYVRKGYQFKAFDFINKSFTENNYAEIIDVLQRIVLDYQTTFDTEQKLFYLRFHDHVQVNKVNDLIGVRREHHHYMIYFTFGKVAYFNTLRSLEEKFKSFPWVIRSHQSALINMHHAKTLVIGGNEIVMDNGLRFPVSRRRYRSVFEHWSKK